MLFQIVASCLLVLDYCLVQEVEDARAPSSREKKGDVKPREESMALWMWRRADFFIAIVYIPVLVTYIPEINTYKLRLKDHYLLLPTRRGELHHIGMPLEAIRSLGIVPKMMAIFSTTSCMM